MPLFRDLVVWQKAHELVLDVYALTAGFPSDERFGLRSQMQRAAVSVPANIAEGQKRGTDRGFAQFLAIAEGSLAELQYYFVLAQDLSYASPAQAQAVTAKSNDVERLLRALRASVLLRASRRGPASDDDGV